jgi:hypothetical protein
VECRNHIHCKQQMKLHMECLQEKIEQMARELIKHKDNDQKNKKNPYSERGP